jgi:hypothetical protein
MTASSKCRVALQVRLGLSELIVAGPIRLARTMGLSVSTGGQAFSSGSRSANSSTIQLLTIIPEQAARSNRA